MFSTPLSIRPEDNSADRVRAGLVEVEWIVALAETIFSSRTLTLDIPPPQNINQNPKRFNKLEWSTFNAAGSKYRYGVIAGAMDNGLLDIWDANALMEKK
jgi:hypothetical protein